MTTSFHIQLHENNEISKVKKTASVFDCLEVSQGPPKEPSPLKRVSQHWQQLGFFFFSYLVMCRIAFLKLSSLGKALIENEISYFIYLISETRFQN